MVKSLGFLFDVFAKDLYVIFAPIKLQRILNLSVSTCTMSTESRGNVVVDSFRVGSFRNETTIKFGLFFQTWRRFFQNHFEVRIKKGNFELRSQNKKRGILNWYCPLWNLMKELSSGMSILTSSLSTQYSKCLSLDALLWNPWRQFRQKCSILLPSLLLVMSNRLRFLIAA